MLLLTITNPFAELKEDQEEAIKTLATDLNSLRTNYTDQVDIDVVIDE